MDTKIVEATNGYWYCKFLVGAFTDEWSRRPEAPNERTGMMSVLALAGWGPERLLVLDLETGNGGIFAPHGYAPADIEKHGLTKLVSPLFRPFLAWLYIRWQAYSRPLAVVPFLHQLPITVSFAEAKEEVSST